MFSQLYILFVITVSEVLISIDCDATQEIPVDEMFNGNSNGGLGEVDEIGLRRAQPVHYVQISDHPYLAQVKIVKDSLSYYCLGALVHPLAVVTAGSCILHNKKAVPPNNVTVLLGTDRVLSGGVSYKVEQFYLDPNYDEKEINSKTWSINDRAVLILEESVQNSSIIKPVKPVTSDNVKIVNDFIKDKKTCYSLSWDTGVRRKIGDKFRLSKYKLVNPKFCTQSVDQYSSNFICAETKNLPQCAFDYGSPLTCDDILIGLNAGKGQCDKIGKPEVFISLTDSFVNDVINNHTRKEDTFFMVVSTKDPKKIYKYLSKLNLITKSDAAPA